MWQGSLHRWRGLPGDAVGVWRGIPLFRRDGTPGRYCWRVRCLRAICRTTCLQFTSASRLTVFCTPAVRVALLLLRFVLTERLRGVQGGLAVAFTPWAGVFGELSVRRTRCRAAPAGLGDVQGWPPVRCGPDDHLRFCTTRRPAPVPPKGAVLPLAH